MHPSIFAESKPDTPAFIMSGSGEQVTYKQLNDRSNQGAQLFRALGVQYGDAVAILMENNPRFLEIATAILRSGIYLTPISSRLTAGEVEYILDHCGAKVFISSKAKADVAGGIKKWPSHVKSRYMVDGTIPGYESYEEAIAAYPAEPIEDEISGSSMLYSSGTTGTPKGIKRPLSGEPITHQQPAALLFKALYGFSESMVYLSPAPLYHAAPLGFTLSILSSGGTAIVMEHFDTEQALKDIDRFKVTHSQWVPTMFVRMLKMPGEIRTKYDLSSLTVAIHAAAPCPIPIKEQIIDWWGPVVFEYYGGSEGNGFCAINSQEWLGHKGSVGRCLLGTIHIVGEDGEDVPTGETGTIYFEGGPEFEYHDEPKRTAEAHNAKGWSTLGDIGRLDEEGYLYLTDRKAFMIISGGVNIFPQETENVLITHPKVADVAVIGVPNEEFGEEVKAIVQPMNIDDAGPELAQELIQFCRDNLAHIKCPKSVDFDPELPRHPTGKLYKRLLRDRYWTGKESKIV